MQESQTDQQLLEQALQGDREAYGQLTRRYQDQLLASIRQCAISYEDAEDIVQEAFLRAYLKLPTFRQRSAFYTWLYRIAMNLMLTQRRSLRSRPFLTPVRPLHANDCLYEDGCSDMERSEEAEAIRQSFAALTDEHRRILFLRGVRGFDYDTIARMLRMNVGTVRSRLHRARMQLHNQLARRLDDRPCAGNTR